MLTSAESLGALVWQLNDWQVTDQDQKLLRIRARARLVQGVWGGAREEERRVLRSNPIGR